VKSVATDVAIILDLAKIGTLGKDLFVGRDLPEDPDNVIIIVDTGTYDTDSPNLYYTSPTFQVIVRTQHGAYQNCYEKIYQIRNWFHGHSYVTGDATKYIYFFTVSGPVDIGYDESDRPRFSVNFRTLRTFKKALLRKLLANQKVESVPTLTTLKDLKEEPVNNITSGVGELETAKFILNMAGNSRNITSVYGRLETAKFILNMSGSSDNITSGYGALETAEFIFDIVGSSNSLTKANGVLGEG